MLTFPIPERREEAFASPPGLVMLRKPGGVQGGAQDPNSFGAVALDGHAGDSWCHLPSSGADEGSQSALVGARPVSAAHVRMRSK